MPTMLACLLLPLLGVASYSPSAFFNNQAIPLGVAPRISLITAAARMKPGEEKWEMDRALPIARESMESMESSGSDSLLVAAVLLCVFVQMLGVGVTVSTLPLFLTAMGATPTQLSLVIASFSAAQMLCCPALVNLSGRIGRHQHSMI